MLNVLSLLAVGALLGAPAPKIARPLPGTPAATAPTGYGDEDQGEDVELKTRDKLTLRGTFFESDKRGKNPAVVLVHDAGSDRSSLAELAAYLQKKGFGVLTVDLRGHGASTSEDLDWSALQDARAQASLWSFAAGDVRAAVEWLRGKDSVHPARVGVAGIGAGAALAVAEALDDRDTSAVAMIAPVAENHGFNLPRNLSDLGGLPTLILAPKDARGDAERLQASAHGANGGEEYVTVETLRSESDGFLQDKKLGSELAKWLKDTLDPSN